MPISTSANTYRRGVPNNYNNFFFAAQANNTIPVPIKKYLRGYSFVNRNYTNPKRTFPWNNI